MKTKATEMAIFALKYNAANAANTDWKGKGSQVQNRPIATALEIECRLKCQRLGWLSFDPRKRNPGVSRSRFGSGEYCLKNCFGMLQMHRVALFVWDAKMLDATMVKL